MSKALRVSFELKTNPKAQIVSFSPDLCAGLSKSVSFFLTTWYLVRQLLVDQTAYCVMKVSDCSLCVYVCVCAHIHISPHNISTEFKNGL